MRRLLRVGAWGVYVSGGCILGMSFAALALGTYPASHVLVDALVFASVLLVWFLEHRRT